MSRLIDADTLPISSGWIEQGNQKVHITFAYEYDIQNSPTVDAVPVVRCKDCVHCPTKVEQDVRFPDDVCPCQCEDDYYYSWIPQPNWFCPNGEKVTE